MSEKQFYICEDEDDIRGNFGEVDKPLNNTEIVDLLNNLHQENQELQEKIMKVTKSNNHYYTEYDRIKEESEQLRQSVNYWQKKYEEGIETFILKQLDTQDTINIQYREIITCLEIIIDELNKENRQLHYQIIKLQDKEILNE